MGVALQALLRTLALLIVCGGCDGGPAARARPPIFEPPEPPADPAQETLDVRGEYSAIYLISFTDLATSVSNPRVCSGALSVSKQDSTSFSGTFSVGASAECPRPQIGTLAGRLLRFGELELDLRVQGSQPNAFPELTGCEYVGDAQRFGGAANTKRLVAINNATVRCIEEGATSRTKSLRIRIDGERTS